MALVLGGLLLSGCSFADNPGNCNGEVCPVDTAALADLQASASPTDTATSASPSSTPSSSDQIDPSDIPSDITVDAGTNTVEIGGQQVTIRAPRPSTATVTTTPSAARPATSAPTSSRTTAAPRTSVTTAAAPAAPAVVNGVTAGHGAVPAGNLSKRQLDAACAMYASGAHADLDLNHNKPANSAYSWSCYDGNGTRLFDGGMSIDGYCGEWSGYTSNKAKPTDPPYAWACVPL